MSTKLSGLSLFDLDNESIPGVYHQLLFNLPIAVYLCDANGYVIQFNKAAVELWGREPDIGKDLWCGWFKIYNTDGTPIPPEECPMALAIKGGRSIFGYEIIIERPNGERRNVMPHPQPIKNSDGVLIGAINMLLDITERSSSKKALMESERRFLTVVDNIPLMIWVADKDTSYSFFNKKWIDFTGRSIEQELGMGWTQGIHPDELKQCLNTYHTSFNKRTEFYMEYRLKRYDGEYRWISDVGVPRYSSDGDFIGFMGSCVDITLKKSINQQRDEFLGIVSHELRTPLTSLKAYTQLFQKEIETNGSSEDLEVVGKMEKQINKLIFLVKDLSDITRIENSNLEFREDWFRMDELLQEIAENFQNAGIKHQIVVQMNLPVKVFGDRERIGQVIINLLTNAVKYSPDADKVNVSLYVDKDELICSLQDFGIGIPKESRETIFERFFRMPDLKIHTFPGLGLGLYISASIIKRLSGRIWVESIAGKGSTFYFALPSYRIDKGSVI